VPLIAEAWADQRIDGKMLPHISAEDLKEDVQISSGAACIPAPVPTPTAAIDRGCRRCLLLLRVRRNTPQGDIADHRSVDRPSDVAQQGSWRLGAGPAASIVNPSEDVAPHKRTSTAAGQGRTSSTTSLRALHVCSSTLNALTRMKLHTASHTSMRHSFIVGY
jgi:hypothetical protein